MARLPSQDWRQWGKEDVHRDPENISADFERFVEVKWLDAISVACWDPTGGSGEVQVPEPVKKAGAGPSRFQAGTSRPSAPPRKIPEAKVSVAEAEDGPRKRHRCRFARMLGLSLIHISEPTRPY